MAEMVRREQVKIVRVLIVKHIENEDAGNILEFLDTKNSASYKKINLYDGDKLPAELDRFSHIVILGGPMNVGEDDKYPFLKDEDAFIRNALKKNVPMLCICLGAQLLANACGAHVYKAENEEVGIFEMEVLEPDAGELGILSAVPKKFPTVHWHRYTFDIPLGAKHLVRSRLCENQAFSVNGNAYGMQFHPEVTEEMARDWFDDVDCKDDIVRDFLSIKREYDEAAREIYSLFFAL